MVTLPSVAGADDAGNATVDAIVRVPSRTTIATPGEDSSRAYWEAVSSDTVTVIALAAAGFLTITEPGATAVRSPTSTIVLEASVTVARASPAA